MKPEYLIQSWIKDYTNEEGWTIFRNYWFGYKRLLLIDSFGGRHYYFNKDKEPLEKIVEYLIREGSAPNNVADGSRSSV